VVNPPKKAGDRMRDYIIGVPFPPSRKKEIKRVSKALGLSVAAYLRTLGIADLDRIQLAKEARKKRRDN
jgi:hypothetical protein